MNDLLLGILVLFSGADGKLIETTSKETAWYLERLYQAPVRCMVDGQADGTKFVVAIGAACRSLEPKLKEQHFKAAGPAPVVPMNRYAVWLAGEDELKIFSEEGKLLTVTIKTAGNAAG
jgi:hypothetical protein